MMRKYFLFLLIFISTTAMAQSTIQGEYIFSRQEMVGVFNFAADGKFEFFYAYGAVDRSATGSYSIEGDMLKLLSDKQGGKDFTITAQHKKDSGYTIKFNYLDKHLLRNIKCMFITNGNMQEIYTGDDGEVHTDFAHCDTIYVQHDLYPDIVTLIKDEKNDNNNFELTLNQSLQQVSFKWIDFKIVNNTTITCMHNYFMPLEGIEFKKNK